MEVVDLQLTASAPFEDWSSADEQTRLSVLIEGTFQYMDAVGVSAAVMNPHEIGEEATWAATLAARFPERFAVVPPFDESEPDVEAHIDALSGRPGAVAIRFTSIRAMSQESQDQFDRYLHGSYDDAFAVCERRGIPVQIEVMGGVGSVRRVAEKFPAMRIMVEHMGLNQPPFQARDDPPWRDLDLTLELARHENVSVKVCAPIHLSDESYPWSDSWTHVARLLAAFGPERLAWASSIGRTRGRIGYRIRLLEAARTGSPARYERGADAVPGPPPGSPDYPGKHTYMDSLAFFLYNDQLSQGEKELILGKNARRFLRWPSA